MSSETAHPDLRAATVGRLSQIGNRTNLMALDALLNALPNGAEPGEGRYADAALEARVVARRMLLATKDFKDAVEQR